MTHEARDGVTPVPHAGPRVLVVDDEAPLVRMVQRLLEPEGFGIMVASDPESLVARLEEQPELLLLDLQLGAVSGVDLIAKIRAQSPDTQIVIMTGYATIDSAVACMREGAFDYLEKPFHDQHRIVQTLQHALERRLLRVRNRELEGELDRRSTLAGIVCQSASMRRVMQTVIDLSRNESNVLIEAESGTGKELIARAIHGTSPRREGPFVPLDCGALPEGIAEGELFGYERGAFTGAVRSTPGVFRTAHGGTLFLDEIGELSQMLQVKLLRVVQEREVKPLGAAHARSIDVRIIAATNRDLAEEVREGRFRADLFYRLRVVPIRLPPLRSRPEDVPLLAAHFLRRCAEGTDVSGFEPEAIEELVSRSWEGNVRELQNAIEAATALAPGPLLRVADLRLTTDAESQRKAPEPKEIELSFEAYERSCLEEALRSCGDDVSRAAGLLGIGRSTLYRKLRAHGLNRS